MKREIIEYENIIGHNPVMVKIDNLPYSVKEDIQDWCDNNDVSLPSDGYLKLETAINYYLMWNGIVGYSDAINSIIESAKYCDIKVDSIL